MYKCISFNVSDFSFFHYQCEYKDLPKPRTLESYFQLKGFDERGFYWYSKYKSPEETKHLSKDSTEHSVAIPLCTLRFLWFDKVEKIISIEGSLEPITHEEMEEAFSTRAKESEVSYWRSDDSKPIGDEELEEKLKALE